MERPQPAQSALIMSAAFSAIMMVGALVYRRLMTAFGADFD
jgi:hypothetical protein